MTYRNENEYLIHLLNCAVHNTVPDDVPEGISLDKVFEAGKLHEVANIAYLALKRVSDKIPADNLAAWREYYYTAVKRDNEQSRARSEILTALHTNGIYTLEVQGTAVKSYYPQRHLRMMSDIDIIIPDDKLSEAESIMQSMGYETGIVSDNTEVHASKEQLYIELHTEFFGAGHTVYKALNHPFSVASLTDGCTAKVTDTVFYLFHLLHTVKHATAVMGIGIRRIIDLYYLEDALKDKADFSYIDGVLKEYDLYSIKEKLIAVKNHWFCGAGTDAGLTEFEEEILRSGNHGTDEIYFRNKLRKEKAEGKHFVKLRYLIGVMFPQKEEIYASYPFCEKHHLPIVICWIYRGAMVFNPKKSKALKALFSKLKTKI